MVYCKKCGAKVSDEFIYCTNCGNRFDAKLGRKIPSDTRQGALVGGLVGFLHGIVAAVQSYFIIFPLLMPLITKQVTSDPRFANNPQFLAEFLSLFNTIMYVAVVLVVPIMALLSCVLGVLFVKFKEHIPGSSIIRKSVVFALILMAISIVPGLPSFLDPRASAIFGTEFFPLQMKSYALTLVEYPLLGWLFGYLLERRLK